jgi:hypothetical protein
MPHKRFWVLFLAFLLSGPQGALAGPFKGPFTGAFYGQGEGCWGGLFIRTRTLDWHPGNVISCEKTAYVVIDKNLHTPFENYDHIVFKLDHLSKFCRFSYIGLYYYQSAQEVENNSQMPGEGLYYDWEAVGFASYKQYQAFPYRGFADSSIDIDPMTVLYCSFPFYGQPFPYGKPLK